MTADRDVDGFLAGLDGRLDAWAWRAGLTPRVVGELLGVDVEPGPVRLGGLERRSAALRADVQPWPLWLVWDPDDELALVRIEEPVLRPTPEQVLSALHAAGTPAEPVQLGQGPRPGARQLVWADRGIAVFDGGVLGIVGVWLFRPTDPATYVTTFEAAATTRRYAR